MKCPNCGSELPQNALFCEKCAAEIKIVPEYEAKLEEQISISLENVASVIEEEKGPAVQISSAAEVLQKAEEEEAAAAGNGFLPQMTASRGDATGERADILEGATMILPSLSGVKESRQEKDPSVIPPDSPEETFFDESTESSAMSEEPVPADAVDTTKAVQELRKEEHRKRRQARYVSRRRFVKFTMVFLVGALVATCVLVLFYARELYDRRHTQSYYVGRAYQFSVDGEYEKAADEIQKAIELDSQEDEDAQQAGDTKEDSVVDAEAENDDRNGGSSEESTIDSGANAKNTDSANEYESTQTVATLYLLKAEYLQKAGKMDLALGAASMALEDDNSTEEEEIAAYGRMIGIYASEEEYAKIATLLSTCTRQQVIDNYLQYALFDPEFSLEEGTYEEPAILQLTDQGEGSIFYTMDGSEPTTESLLYTGPIELTEGTFTVSAIYVNHFNLASSVISRTYTILGSGNSE